MGNGGLDLTPEPRTYPEDRFDAVVDVGAWARPGELQVVGEGQKVALSSRVDFFDGIHAAVVEHYLGVGAQALAHGRSRGEYYEVAFVETGGEAVEVFEAGLDAGYLAFLLVEALDHLQGTRSELRNGRKVLPERPIRDAVDELLRRIERLANVFGLPESVLGD